MGRVPSNGTESRVGREFTRWEHVLPNEFPIRPRQFPVQSIGQIHSAVPGREVGVVQSPHFHQVGDLSRDYGRRQHRPSVRVAIAFANDDFVVTGTARLPKAVESFRGDGRGRGHWALNMSFD